MFLVESNNSGIRSLGRALWFILDWLEICNMLVGIFNVPSFNEDFVNAISHGVKV
jgi:hypothetical protein